MLAYFLNIYLYLSTSIQIIANPNHDKDVKQGGTISKAKLMIAKKMKGNVQLERESLHIIEAKTTTSMKGDLALPNSRR